MSILILPDHLYREDKRAQIIFYVERLVEKSITHWEKYSNSRIAPDQQKFHHERYQELTDETEEILTAIGLKVDWPGLHPSMKLPDGSTEHDIGRAINTILSQKV